MSKEIKESMIFYRSFYKSISKFPDDVQFFFYRSIVLYGLDLVEPDFSLVPNQYQPFVEAVWDGIRPQLDANHRRFHNGNKGGAPKGNQNARKQPKNNLKTTMNNQKQPNKNDNVKENDNDNKKTSLELPFSDKEFIDTWNDLRSQPKWRRKTAKALQKSLDRLSRYDVRFAIELMNTAIENGYQGVVYDDTPSRYEQWMRSHPQPQSGKAGDMNRDNYSAYDFD